MRCEGKKRNKEDLLILEFGTGQMVVPGETPVGRGGGEKLG